MLVLVRKRRLNQFIRLFWRIILGVSLIVMVGLGQMLEILLYSLLFTKLYC